MDLGLKGRRALVMGGNKGLGRSIADALAAEGASIVISGRDQGGWTRPRRAEGRGRRRGLRRGRRRGQQRDMDKLAEAAVKAMGGVDILVLNHGGPPPCTASRDHGAGAAGMVPAHRRLADPHHQRAAAGDARAQWGRIIVVGSTGMQQPIPTLALSNTLRASIWGWLKTLSGEVAKDGVTMNVLAPGTILPTAPRTPRRGRSQGRLLREARPRPPRSIPAGRLGTPAEYRPMGAFLASEKGGYVTGSMIVPSKWECRQIE